MTVVKSDALRELVDPDDEVERLGTGFTFTEGPVWNAEGEFLLFSDMPGDVRRRWSEQDGVTEIMRPANKCMPETMTRAEPPVGTDTSIAALSSSAMTAGGDAPTPGPTIRLKAPARLRIVSAS